ncbi:hypothetical protein FA95DRAFT_1503466 [Auriscalpium vulgare]|uniref:Uncharacterized protein n=1 Tax=Auriscalpium vulgare TaxID=40419 RepID=A0ACB8R7J7_9AGAM|nr:hypothetical protein FA95DRAFT_1503466 [Auriscalpium vulgare]
MLEAILGYEAAEDLGCPCSAARCSSTAADIHCCYCFYRRMLCRHCAVKIHFDNAFHQVEDWVGTYFKRRGLQELGLVIRLGHGGDTCHFAKEPVSMTVTHVNGIHTCNVQFCGCFPPDKYNPVDVPLQLANAGLWPASYKNPRTATTFHAAWEYNQFFLQAKVNVMDYNRVKLCITNNAFRDDVPVTSQDQYRQLLTSQRQFMFIQTLKQFGASVQDRYAAGSLVVLCPACPQPGKNMDPGWKDVPAKDQYVHALFYAKDGNFQLHQHMKKMDLDDVAFTRGGGYYVDDVEGSNFLKIMDNDPESSKETSTCNKFFAINGKRLDGKRITGVVSLVCAPHGMIMGSSTVDLTKGERYILSSLHLFCEPHLLS